MKKIKILIQIRERCRMGEKLLKQYNPEATLNEIEEKFQMFQILNEKGEIVNEEV